MSNETYFQWNYGSAGNLAEARKIISAIRASGYSYGIYSSPGVRHSVLFAPAY